MMNERRDMGVKKAIRRRLMQMNADLLRRESYFKRGKREENDVHLHLAKMSLHLCRETPMKMFILRPKEYLGYYAGRGFVGSSGS